MSCSSSTPLSPRVLAPRHVLRAWGLATLLAASACVDDPTAIHTGPGGPMLATGSTEVNIGNLGGPRVAVLDMNDAGQLVGESPFSLSTSTTVGFLWELGAAMLEVPPQHECPSRCRAFRATAINNSGTVVGSGSGFVFRWSNSGGLETIVRDGVSLSDINDVGDAVGYGRVFGIGGEKAFIWTAAGDTIIIADAGFYPSKINNARQVLLRDGFLRPMFWHNGTLLPVGTLGGLSSRGTDLNNAGQVVGESYIAGDGAYHAFLWAPGTGMQDLGTLGGTNSSARAVNASGQVVGWSKTENGGHQAFRWTPGEGMRDLGRLVADRPGGSEAFDINDAGEVAGVSTAYPATGDPISMAMLWTETGGMQALGPGIGQFINNNRQVAGGHVLAGSPAGWRSGDAAHFWHNIVVNTPPSVDAGGPYVSTEGQPILFNGSATDPDGDDLTVAWDFNGDGAADSSGVQVRYTFAIPGTYTVRLFVTDETGVTRTDDATVTVGPARWPSAVIVLPPGGVYTGTETSRILLSSEGSASQDGGPLFYRWEFGDGTYAQSRYQTTPFNWSKIYADNGTYTARLIVWDTSRRSDTATVQVVVRNAPPTGSFVILSVVYENTDFPMTVQNATDSAVADRRAGFTYAFDCGTGAGYGAFSATVTQSCRAPVDNTPFTTGAKIRDKDGGEREYRRTLTVRNVRPYVTGATWANGVLTIGFSDVGTADAPWRWTVVWGDGTRSTGSVNRQGPATVQAPHTYAGPGPYDAQVYVYDKDRAPASPVYPVTITP